MLLDNCVPLRVGSLLTGHEVRHCAEQGWETLRNGELFRRAAESFAAVVTADQNIRYQSDLAALPLSVVEIRVRDTRSARIRSMQEPLVDALALSAAYRSLSVGEDGSIERLVPRM
ncbi:MAG: hypothetical protein K2Q09_05505 [Phycisphaerales bacterium]|nr:hypothetical protein [Phycisphaerales bacterium]